MHVTERDRVEDSVRKIISDFRDVTKKVQQLNKRIESGELNLKNNDYLELKSLVIVEYIADLQNLIATKTLTGTIRSECDDIIERLIEHKLVLEKCRGLDRKLKYHFDRLVRDAMLGDAAASTRLRARPENFTSNEPAAKPTKTTPSAESDASKTNTFVVPKMKSVRYADTVADARQSNRATAGANDRLNLSAAIRQNLLEEYGDEPLEVAQANGGARHVISKREQEVRDFEEDFLTRLPQTKAAKANKRKLTTIGSVADEILMDTVGLSYRARQKSSGKKTKSKKAQKLKNKKKGSKKRQK